MVGDPEDRLEQARVWLVRLLAPAAFLVAAIVLVIVVQRALDHDAGAESAQPAGPAATVPVTTVLQETATTATGATEPRYYRIRAGDTLEAIAQKFQTTVDQLLALNPGVDQLALQPGERIRVA